MNEGFSDGGYGSMRAVDWDNMHKCTPALATVELPVDESSHCIYFWMLFHNLEKASQDQMN